MVCPVPAVPSVPTLWTPGHAKGVNCNEERGRETPLTNEELLSVPRFLCTIAYYFKTIFVVDVTIVSDM